MNNFEFTTLISDKAQFYCIEAKFNDVKVKFYDSFKVLPFSVDYIAKSFNMCIEKLELDYHAKREEGHILTENEKNYIINDALIIARALKILFELGLTKITTAGNAMYSYKKIIGGGKIFRRIFPVLECDSYLRKAYKGGWTYLNPIYAGKLLNNGDVFDVNSLYPSVLHSNYLLPLYTPIFYKGNYIKDKKYNLYIQHLICQFELKKGFLPTIQLKNSSIFLETEYLTSSDGNDIELYLTNIDLQLFFEHYDVYNIEWVDGYKFQSQGGMFDDYIDFWIDKKIKSKEEENFALYTISKLMLNSLYGRFALNPKVKSKIPYLDNDIVKYKITEEEERESVYSPIAIFCTAYARYVTIKAAQEHFNIFIYADTDSLHLLKGDYNLKIDDFKLGFWKHEAEFKEAKFIRSKMYMEKIKNKDEYEWKITGAGMPNNIKNNVNLDNFKKGSVFTGKLLPKHVKGGVVLVDTTFTIK